MFFLFCPKSNLSSNVNLLSLRFHKIIYSGIYKVALLRTAGLLWKVLAKDSFGTSYKILLLLAPIGNLPSNVNLFSA